MFAPAWALLAASLATPAVARESGSARYVYYLHGKIVEDSGPRGVSPKFGASDYPGIVRALSKSGARVISEVRPKDTDPSAYADKIVAQVRRQVRSGVPASRITIVGASKGSVIAMLVSTRLKDPGVRYVLLANCNDWLIRTFDPHLTGEVLSIYETSDDVGESCAPLAKRSPAIRAFREVRLTTGLGHGIVYRPLQSWVAPTLAWVRR